jgi:tetratricopeptide (TPR) repeat protein
VTIANEHGEYADAEEMFAESLALWRHLGDAANIAGVLSNGAEVFLRQGRFVEAERCLNESLQIFAGLRSPVGSAYAVTSISEIASRQDEPDRAVELARESLTIFRVAADRRGCGLALRILGEAMLSLGHDRMASAYLNESLALFLATTDPLGVLRTLEAGARRVLSHGDRHKSARLFGLAAGMRDVLEVPVWATDRSRYELELAALADAGPIFAAARAERATSLNLNVSLEIEPRGDSKVAGWLAGSGGVGDGRSAVGGDGGSAVGGGAGAGRPERGGLDGGS